MPPGEVWHCSETFLVVTSRGCLASGRQKKGMLLNILSHTRQPLTIRNYLPQNVNTIKLGNPSFKRNRELEIFPKHINTKCFANWKTEPHKQADNNFPQRQLTDFLHKSIKC